MAESSFRHGHWDNVGSFLHLRIPQNIHLYAANLCNGNSAKYFTHYAILQSINTPNHSTNPNRHSNGNIFYTHFVDRNNESNFRRGAVAGFVGGAGFFPFF